MLDTTPSHLVKAKPRKLKQNLKMEEQKDGGFSCKTAISVFRGCPNSKLLLKVWLKATILTIASGWPLCLQKLSQSRSSKIQLKWLWSLHQVCVKICCKTTKVSITRLWMIAASQVISKSCCSHSRSSTLLFRTEESSERSAGTSPMHSHTKTSMFAEDNLRFS